MSLRVRFETVNRHRHHQRFRKGARIEWVAQELAFFPDRRPASWRSGPSGGRQSTALGPRWILFCWRLRSAVPLAILRVSLVLCLN